MKEIIVDGVVYQPKSQNGEMKIIVLQRGWVMIGKLTRNGSDCTVTDASIIRKWGTTKGLGEIAKNGPTNDTVLDPCYGEQSFDYLTVVFTMSVNSEKWSK